jgi:hypothetical protein
LPLHRRCHALDPWAPFAGRLSKPAALEVVSYRAEQQPRVRRPRLAKRWWTVAKKRLKKSSLVEPWSVIEAQVKI